ncbi:MAG: hypothetical protein K6U80_12210 [Firmicutes bacterium]|nr:hypothetical protein [Bacillota bacterium]
MNKKILGIILIAILALSICGIALAADIGPALPSLKLTVEMSPLDVYPPIMIYTAQLSYMPPVNTILKADFYHVDATSTAPIYLGSAAFDKTGKAVLSKQIKAGAYIAYAITVINGTTIVSNKVEYRVP